jgi:lysophospholipase L1-like esterase
MSLPIGRHGLASAALLMVSLVVASVIAEVVLRAVVGRPMLRSEPQVRYDPHPIRRFTLRPNQEAYTYTARVRVGPDGYRSNGPHQSSAGARLFVLGDSFTFGLGVADDETWPARLEQRLGSQVPGGVRVINSGVVSYGVFQEMNMLRERGLRMRPTVVIHALYWNDYMTPRPPQPGDPAVLTPDGYFIWDQETPPHGLMRRAAWPLMRRSALAWSVFTVLQHFRESEDGASDYGQAYRRLVDGVIRAEQWEPVTRFYEQLKALADTAGFVPYVVILPVIDIVKSRDPDAHPYPRYVRGLLDRLGIGYLDCFALWQGKRYGGDTFLPQGPDAHLSAKGYAFLADELAQALMADPAVAARLASGAR